MFTLRTILAIGFLTLSLWAMILNWGVVLGHLFLKRRTGSWMPLLGGLLGCFGALIAPSPAINGYWWAPLLLDWGSAPGLTFTLASFAPEWIGRARSRP